MTAFTGRWWRMLLFGLFLCLASACGTAGRNDQPAEPTTTSTIGDTAAADPEPIAQRGERPAPDPISIDVTLDDGAAVTETIGPNGGTLSASLPDGGTATLTVPVGVLLSDVGITMTPIASVSGEGLDGATLAGVQLEPDGLAFLGLVELEVIAPGVADDWVGVSARGDGGDLHVVPSEPTDGSSVIAINHFSLAGVADEQLADVLRDHPPSSDQAAWVSELADVDRHGGSFNLVLETFADWAKDLTDRFRLVTDDEDWERATVELVSLIDRLERRVQDRRNAGHELTDAALEARVDYPATAGAWLRSLDSIAEQHFARCDADGPNGVFPLLRWEAIVVAVGGRTSLLGFDPSDPSSPRDLARDCLTFEVRWEVVVIHMNSTLQRTWRAKAHASGIVQAFSTFIDAPLEGAAIEVVVSDYFEDDQLSSVLPCSPVTTPGSGWIGMLISDPVIPNLGDLTTGRIEALTVTVFPAEDTSIVCAEYPLGRNKWLNAIRWMEEEARRAERQTAFGFGFVVPVDPQASPPGSSSTLETNRDLATTVFGPATYSVNHSLVVEHRPGGAG